MEKGGDEWNYNIDMLSYVGSHFDSLPFPFWIFFLLCQLEPEDVLDSSI